MAGSVNVNGLMDYGLWLLGLPSELLTRLSKKKFGPSRAQSSDARMGLNGAPPLVMRKDNFVWTVPRTTGTTRGTRPQLSP